MNNLIIVATPIGNLQDISDRAIKTLLTVDYVACEDTRITGNLIAYFKKKYPQYTNKVNLISFYEQNENYKTEQILNLLALGNSVALVSDAGTPTISDPGFKLVRECINRGYGVISVPGPSAAISALVTSGFPTDKFTFIGYLPDKNINKIKLLNKIKLISDILPITYIVFISPYKLVKDMEVMQDVLGNIQVALCKELTKIHEKVERSSISDLIDKYTLQKPKGEYVLVFSSGKN